MTKEFGKRAQILQTKIWILDNGQIVNADLQSSMRLVRSLEIDLQILNCQGTISEDSLAKPYERNAIMQIIRNLEQMCTKSTTAKQSSFESMTMEENSGKIQNKLEPQTLHHPHHLSNFHSTFVGPYILIIRQQSIDKKKFSQHLQPLFSKTA